MNQTQINAVIKKQSFGADSTAYIQFGLDRVKLLIAECKNRSAMEAILCHGRHLMHQLVRRGLGVPLTEHTVFVTTYFVLELIVLQMCVVKYFSNSCKVITKLKIASLVLRNLVALVASRRTVLGTTVLGNSKKIL